MPKIGRSYDHIDMTKVADLACAIVTTSLRSRDELVRSCPDATFEQILAMALAQEIMNRMKAGDLDKG